MGSCIICGTSVDGHICDLHQEDAAFEFRGDHPEQLTPDRYYRGTVDGYAEFGVFVDIGDRVTGLLHRSEIDRRLESLEWEAGDVVFVRVQQIRDNGNVDLGWSIRQSADEFRGMLVDDPEEGTFVREDEDEKAEEEKADSADESAEASADHDDAGGDDDQHGESGGDESPGDDHTDETGEDGAAAESATTEQVGQASADSASADSPEVGETASAAGEHGGAKAAATAGGGAEGVVEQLSRVAVESLADRVDDDVRIEGVVEDVNQTSGPTVFTIRDESGTVECAAFEEAGVRAYPGIGTDDVVRLDGEVRKRRGDLQVETEALVVLEDEDGSEVETRLSDALDEQARPDAVEPLASDETVEALAEEVREVATAIRRAVIEERPVIVRHSATADGYAGGVALERATLDLVRDQHDAHDAVYHYFDRRPLEDGVYDMDDATNDLTGMLDARERHGEKLPLFVFVAAGATRDSLDGFELLGLYGARTAVVDAVETDPAVAENATASLTPPAEAVGEVTATTLAANVAANVNEGVRDELAHLPAVSHWEDAPEAYLDAAADAGFDAETTRDVRQAVALEAYYQSYEDKRELIADLLFAGEGGPGGLAGHVSEQFREKMSAELATAEANLDHQTVDGVRIAVLDTDAYTHRYEFPPTGLLLDELHRRHHDGVDALLGVSDDELFIRSDQPVDVRDVAERASGWVGDAALAAKSARDGTLEYLAGERSTVLDAVVDVLGDELA